MKTTKYMLLALATLLTASCMNDDWDAPSDPAAGQDSYGNQYIQATNLVTIAQLRSQYSTAIAPSSNSSDPIAKITKPTQIEVVVTGNDIGGNLYNQFAVADETGAILIDVYQSGLHGFLPVGQKLLVELEGLYIGGYGKQAQIGMPYNNGTYTRPSRMSRYEWAQHYRLTGNGQLQTVTPRVISSINALNINADDGTLVTLRGVELQDADGKAVFAPSDGSVTASGGAINRKFKRISESTLVLRTSTFADFANKPMPQGPVDVTGIATRFNNTWQILMRDESDIQPSSQTGGDDTPAVEPSGSGTEAAPYNVAAIVAYTQALAADTQSPELYVQGIITKIDEIDTDGNYGNATYYIADSETELDVVFEVYRGYGLNGQKFNAAGARLIKVGNVVTIKGKVVNFRGTTPEFAQGSVITNIGTKID